MKLFWSYFGAILIGGAFVGLGYAIFTGNPIPDQNITYGGVDPNAVQTWLIEKFGEFGTGLGLICSGAVLATYLVVQGHRNKG